MSEPREEQHGCGCILSLGVVMSETADVSVTAQFNGA